MPDWKWYPQFIGLVKDPDGKHYQKMGMAKWLFDFLCADADRKTGEWIGGLIEITKHTGIPLYTVKRYMRILKKKGYVSARRHTDGMLIKISKYKTLVLQESGAPTMEDISKDSRTPLEKNPKSTLYIAKIDELQEYFKGILKKHYLDNHDTYILLQMYWDGVPFVVIKNTTEDIMATTKSKNIFTVRYFKDAIYENHKKYTHRLEPEKSLMPEKDVEKKKKFHDLIGGVVKEKKYGTEEEII